MSVAVAPPLLGARPASRPSMARLTGVELRKMVDTRAGRWLLIVTAVVDVALLVATLVWGGGRDTGLATLFVVAVLAPSVVLPILGVLVVTSEWSQRTALTTFLLTPQRQRVVAAKLFATVVWAVLATTLALVVGALGVLVATVLDRGDGGWSLPAVLVGLAALNAVIGGLMGAAFGLALLSTPLALVAWLGLPIAWSVVAEVVRPVRGVAQWLDINAATGPLLDNEMTGTLWAHLGTSVLAWVALPMVLGWWRVMRAEPS